MAAAVLLAGLAANPARAAEDENPQVLRDFLTRIGGTGADSRFETVVDASLSADGKDVFVVTAKNGKPCVKGNTPLAVTTGINWYLNHTARINLTWNRLTADLASAALPVPSGEERHACTADYRYYLNYCTFSYSMSTWTWERWQQEIDWMALHGINMPLQIVGLDVVWKRLLTEHLGYSAADANAFIAGPCFQAWWGMNNLQGWGGPNPDWWYARQEQLCKKILARERELGMQPVLPGYSGMVPADIGSHGYSAVSQGNWCGFLRPYILDPNSAAFADVAGKYYQVLHEVMQPSAYYSMDPFHEGANTSGIDVAAAYGKIAEAMLAAQPDAKWVIQYWQWSAAQYNVLSSVEKGRLIVLDLFSDAHTHFGEYQGHDAVYCMLHNFGGRTGFYGRLDKVMREYFSLKGQYDNIKGVGATPEAIETVPVLYDALFELPWRATAPDGATWLRDYAASRYGVENAEAQAAWEQLRTSSLDCGTSLQGPMEAVVCARPALAVNAVSSWGGTAIFYDSRQVTDAAHRLLEAGLSGENYDYDLTDLSRQALTDYAYYLLKALDKANADGDAEAFARLRDTYLRLLLDLDELLNTNEHFMLGRWTTMARGIADEADGTTDADRDWLEQDNARTLITTWGAEAQANAGGLRDYSYREWGGMMKDYYYPRWKDFFDNGAEDLGASYWYGKEHAWATDGSLSYSAVPVGETAEVARRLFDRYFLKFPVDGGASCYYLYRALKDDQRAAVADQAFRGGRYVCPATLPEDVTATLSVDMNNDGVFLSGESATGTAIDIPTAAVAGKVRACLELSDGTEFLYSLVLRDDVTEPREVSVRSEDAAAGSASIDGSAEQSVNTTDDVTVRATPAAGYDFLNWTNDAGDVVSNENPYTYYGKEAASFTARFIVNRWGSPTEDKSEYDTMSSYGQYVTSMTVAQNGQDPADIYSAESCPAELFQTTRIVNAAKGSRLTLAWKDTDDADGLRYCRLSAYIDLNADGDFEDEGEFLAVVGEKDNSGNSMLSDGSLSILLPYEMPLGITHVRLRFDSSWIGGWDPATDAMPAKAPTKRMVYDVPLNVVEYALQACSVEVASSDETRGSVDTNGHSNPYTVAVGEDVIVRAYPSPGYRLKAWTDQYGRVVGTEPTCMFKVPESGRYVAEFVPDGTLAVGDWTFGYDDTASGVVLTSIEGGSGALDLTQVPEGVSLGGIAEGLFRGNTALTALTLPAGRLALDYHLQAALAGTGESNAVLVPDETVPADRPFTLSFEVGTDGSTFNQWGSGLLATGPDALADAYDGGFQFYLKADGSLVLKLGSAENLFSSTTGASSFSVTMDYDGNAGLGVRVTGPSGSTETKALTASLAAISLFSSSIPAGMAIRNLRLADYALGGEPFKGCTRLAEISVGGESDVYSSLDGILYDASGTTLLAYPEGRFCTRLFTIADKDGRLVHAAPQADAAGAMLADGDRGVYVSTDAPLPAALWQLALEGDAAYRVCHLNSRHLFGGKAGDHSRMEMPADSTRWYGTYTLSRATRGIDDVTLQAGSGHVVTLDAQTAQLALSEGEEGLADATSHWTFSEVDAIPVSVQDFGWTALCLPVPVRIPSGVEGLKVFKVAAREGDALRLEEVTGVLPALEGALVYTGREATVDFPVSHEPAPALAGNLLCGATIRRTGLTAGTYYALACLDGSVGFYPVDMTEVPANKAYLPQSRIGAGAASALRFRWPEADGIRLPGSDAPGGEAYYDLQGRRVLYPVRGIYVNGRGEKVFIR